MHEFLTPSEVIIPQAKSLFMLETAKGTREHPVHLGALFAIQTFAST
jgi:hypothetical protein